MNSIVASSANPRRVVDRKRIVGRIKQGWAYEMRLVAQNGCWVVAELRVFPDRGELDQFRLMAKIRTSKFLGHVERTAKLKQQLARLKARPDDAVGVPAGGLTARHLRQISFGTGSALATLNDVEKEVEKMLVTVARGERPPARGAERLARIARCYVEARAQGSRQPNAYVARQLKMKPSQVRDAIFQARQNGLLSSTSKRGRAGGVLTSKALEILRAMTQGDRVG